MSVNRAAVELFSPKLLERMSAYCPPDKTIAEGAVVLSGRMLEEVVELHLESGGTPTTALMHVMDAITNESFKIKSKLGSGGVNQTAYPSVMITKYNRPAVISEIADAFFLLVVNMINSEVSPTELLRDLKHKLDKLEQAKKEGRLIITAKGTFYVQK